MSRWIRLDTTWSSSEWIEGLKPASRLAWVELLCYVKAHGISGRCKRSLVALRNVTGVTRNAIVNMEKAALKDGALVIEAGHWIVTGWGEYQSDQTAKDRMRAYRERQQALSDAEAVDPETTVTRNERNVTPTETKTETKTETTTLSSESVVRAHEIPSVENPIAGLDDVTAASVRGLYGGPEREGTDERVWARVLSCTVNEREAMLATAVLRWQAETHERFNSRLFRAILVAVVDEFKAAGSTLYDEDGNDLWLADIERREAEDAAQ